MRVAGKAVRNSEMPLGMILKVSSSSGSTENVESTDIDSRASTTASSNQENSTMQVGSPKNWNSKTTPLGMILKSPHSSPQPIVNDDSSDDDSRAGSKNLTSPPRRRAPTPVMMISAFSSGDEWHAPAIPQFLDDSETSELFASKELTSPPRRRAASPVARISSSSPPRIVSNAFSSEYHTPATSVHEERRTIPALYPKDLMSSPRRKSSLPPQRMIHPSQELTSPPRRATSPRNTIRVSTKGLTSPPRKGSSAQRTIVSPKGLTSPPRKKDGQDKIMPSKELTTPRRMKAGQQLTIPSNELTSPPRKRTASPKRQILSPKELTSPPRKRAASPRRTITSSKELSSPPRRRAPSPVRMINVSPKEQTSPPRRRETSPFRAIVSSSPRSAAPDPSSHHESSVGCRSLIYVPSPTRRAQSPLGTILKSDYPLYTPYTDTMYSNSLGSTPAPSPMGRNLKTASPSPSPSRHDSSYRVSSPYYDTMDIDSRASTPTCSNHASKYLNSPMSTTQVSLSNPRVQMLPKEGHYNRVVATGQERIFFTDDFPPAQELIPTFTNSISSQESGELFNRSAEAPPNVQSEEMMQRSSLFNSPQWRAEQDHSRGSEWFSVARSQSDPDPDNRAAVKEAVALKEQAVGTNTAAVREAIASSVKLSLLPRPQYRVKWAESIDEKFSNSGVFSMSCSSDVMDDEEREKSLFGNESEGDDFTSDNESASSYSSAEQPLPSGNATASNFFGLPKFAQRMGFAPEDVREDSSSVAKKNDNSKKAKKLDSNSKKSTPERRHSGKGEEMSIHQMLKDFLYCTPTSV